MAIGNWNAAVTMAFLLFAIMLGLLLGAALAGLSLYVSGAIALGAALTGLIAFRLMAHVDRKVEKVRLSSHGA